MEKLESALAVTVIFPLFRVVETELPIVPGLHEAYYSQGLSWTMLGETFVTGFSLKILGFQICKKENLHRHNHMSPNLRTCHDYSFLKKLLKRGDLRDLNIDWFTEINHEQHSLTFTATSLDIFVHDIFVGLAKNQKIGHVVEG